MISSSDIFVNSNLSVFYSKAIDSNLSIFRFKAIAEKNNPATMPGQKFYDVPGGDTVMLEIVDEDTGYRQPMFPFLAEQRSEHFNAIRDIECRPDDIFLNSYPKTGIVTSIRATLCQKGFND